MKEVGWEGLFNAREGDVPGDGPIFSVGDVLYGTTWTGGYGRGVCKVAGCGVVFSIAP